MECSVCRHRCWIQVRDTRSYQRRVAARAVAPVLEPPQFTHNAPRRWDGQTSSTRQAQAAVADEEGSSTATPDTGRPVRALRAASSACRVYMGAQDGSCQWVGRSSADRFRSIGVFAASVRAAVKSAVEIANGQRRAACTLGYIDPIMRAPNLAAMDQSSIEAGIQIGRNAM